MRAIKTLGHKRLVQEVKANRSADLPLDHERPKTRAECPPHPCPFVGCRHHLYLDVTKAGSLVINFPGEPDEMQATCSLDLAEPRDSHPSTSREGLTLSTIGGMMGVTRERIRQVEAEALQHVRESGLEPNNVVEYARGASRMEGT